MLASKNMLRYLKTKNEIMEKDMETILVMSDIHANLTALNQVLGSISMEQTDGIMILGDSIDYGPRSNEVIERLMEFPKGKILVNIWGNHEQAVMAECYERFSHDRGKECAKYTKSRLSECSKTYINGMNSKGWQEFEICGNKCLAVHGSLDDIFWKSIDENNCDLKYQEYDYVFSGHSHIPCYMEKYYECPNPEYCNKKKTVFINPGSVGQPRNHNPYANFAVLNMKTGEISLRSVEYDYKAEMGLFSENVDRYYEERLAKGV